MVTARVQRLTISWHNAGLLFFTVPAFSTATSTRLKMLKSRDEIVHFSHRPALGIEVVLFSIGSGWPLPWPMGSSASANWGW